MINPEPRCDHCGQTVPWVTTRRAAREIGCNVAYVRQLIREGRLPGSVVYGPGHGTQRIPTASLEAYLEAKENR